MFKCNTSDFEKYPWNVFSCFRGYEYQGRQYVYNGSYLYNSNFVYEDCLKVGIDFLSKLDEKNPILKELFPVAITGFDKLIQDKQDKQALDQIVPISYLYTYDKTKLRVFKDGSNQRILVQDSWLYDELNTNKPLISLEEVQRHETPNLNDPIQFWANTQRVSVYQGDYFIGSLPILAIVPNGLDREESHILETIDFHHFL